MLSKVAVHIVILLYFIVILIYFFIIPNQFAAIRAKLFSHFDCESKFLVFLGLISIKARFIFICVEL